MTAIKEIIGDGTKPLETFDEALFGTIVNKVVVIGRKVKVKEKKMNLRIM